MKPEDLLDMVSNALAARKTPLSWRMTHATFLSLWPNEPAGPTATPHFFGLPIEFVPAGSAASIELSCGAADAQ